jgi:pantoate--beta-alanine ligase
VDVITAPSELRKALDAARDRGRTVGFVATMGFFHEGHLSLMRRARADRDVVAVSIFVNPLQFGPQEDFASYPRDTEADLRRAEGEGVDVVFLPEVGDMYPAGEPQVTVDPGPLGGRLEGASRPGHFRGVLTVVAKLFHLVGESSAYFGEKDYQQLVLVRRMAAELSFRVDVVGCPTVRDPDGLAMSSRNVHLSPGERTAALGLSRSLRAAAGLLREGARRSRTLVARMGAEIRSEPLIDLDYADVVDEDTLEPIEIVDRPARALVAARVGTPRLIDNMLLESGL